MKMTETMMEIIRVIGSKIQEHLSFILLMMSIFLALRFVNVVISFDAMTLVGACFLLIASIVVDLNRQKQSQSRKK
jgi:hypothetical protein